MCMAVYLASDKPLRLVTWDEADPRFNVTDLTEQEAGVRQQFTKPFVYYAGAHTGCSCGFSYGQYEATDEEDERREAAARASVSELAAYLSAAAKAAGDLELYACWDGDQQLQPEYRAILHPSEVGGATFTFKERQFAQILPDAA